MESVFCRRRRRHRRRRRRRRRCRRRIRGGAGAGAGRGRIKKTKNCKRVCVYRHSSYLFLGYLFFLICGFKQLLLLLYRLLYRLYRLSLSLSLSLSFFLTCLVFSKLKERENVSRLWPMTTFFFFLPEEG